jgi:hypothetical protein
MKGLTNVLVFMHVEPSNYCMCSPLLLFGYSQYFKWNNECNELIANDIKMDIVIKCEEEQMI